MAPRLLHLVILGTALLSGCASIERGLLVLADSKNASVAELPLPATVSVRGVSPDQTAEEQWCIARYNADTLERFRAAEGAFYAGSMRAGGFIDRPRFGLALSGGGIRAAAFSIGILQGLTETGQLEYLDVISSVSGGSYASGWFYSNLADPAVTPSDLFVANSPALTKVERLPFVPDPTAAAMIARTLLWQAAVSIGEYKLLKKGYLRDWHQLTRLHRAVSIARDLYATRIRSKFLASRDPHWTEIAISTRGRLPLQIINATRGAATNTPLDQISYQFTPLGHGYPALQQLVPSSRATLADAIAVSSAALDRPNHPISVLQWLAGIAIGEYGVALSITGTPIMLTDGGYSDNLATYPLVQRLCHSILIVDASADPDYAFHDYWRLKTRLRNELNIDLNIPEIEQRAAGSTTPTSPIMRGTITGFVLPKDSGGVDALAIHVAYAKLQFDARRSDYPDVARETYVECQATNRCAFPFDSTRIQNFTQRHFAAYRELGRWTARQAVASDDLALRTAR